MDTTPSQPTRLHVVTFDQPTTQPAQHDCAGYTCIHPRCVEDRAKLAARGARTRVPQPWDTRRAA